ncbi:UDP-glucose/GDP-mannose dehydrogenase family protein [Streptomyces ficellus]|uniref:UDP-glucose 6-dehydrogenase n=1 Tax=Streptomyces ficellus TaxID=1977088 RepID=A0ABT7Z700_9ACTN|nr:UDP-glucose/GDP-mannose dehydrogenase family protein [Streptomyces ficellus]MDN3295216.1 UDP-glucose/GDP-mannose dehydrogenase family protein [Streptomyces ficellus]
MRVAIVGQGYVGVTGAVALARQGHQVTGIEREPARLAALEAGRTPVSEPGLQEELSLAMQTGRLNFAADLKHTHVREPFEAVLITVGSPPDETGAADLSQVTSALLDVAALLPAPAVVLKSTVPPGTSTRLLQAHPQLRDRYAYNPEFLNQGSALDDWTTPSRTVVGLWSQSVLPVLHRLYGELACPWVVTSPDTAEMIKYASNSFLAMKISFANEMARLCATPDLNIDKVMQGAGLDPRIGHAFLQPGLGFGDSCLPKDTAALAHWAAARGVPTPLLDAAIAVNRAQPGLVGDMLRQELGDDLAGSEIAVLGARYEPWSDDMRAAPSRALVPRLVAEAAAVRVWDPATDAEHLRRLFPGAQPCLELATAVQGARAVVILTEWPETIEADWSLLAARMAPPAVIVDGKNCLLPDRLTGLPLTYRSVGNRLPDLVAAPAGTPRPATNA